MRGGDADLLDDGAHARHGRRLQQRARDQHRLLLRDARRFRPPFRARPGHGNRLLAVMEVKLTPGSGSAPASTPRLGVASDLRIGEGTRPCASVSNLTNRRLFLAGATSLVTPRMGMAEASIEPRNSASPRSATLLHRLRHGGCGPGTPIVYLLRHGGSSGPGCGPVPRWRRRKRWSPRASCRPPRPARVGNSWYVDGDRHGPVATRCSTG